MFDEFRQDVQATRYTGGGYVGGIWQAGTPSDPFTIRASVQPARDRDLQLLPEGRRVLAAYRLYSEDELRTASEDGDEADMVTLYGEDFEVHKLGNWNNGLIDHYRYLAVRRQPA